MRAGAHLCQGEAENAWGRERVPTHGEVFNLLWGKSFVILEARRDGRAGS